MNSTAVPRRLGEPRLLYVVCHTIAAISGLFNDNQPCAQVFRWFYGVSLACGAMCLILAIGGRTIAAGVFGAAAGVFGYLAGGER